MQVIIESITPGSIKVVLAAVFPGSVIVPSMDKSVRDLADNVEYILRDFFKTFGISGASVVVLTPLAPLPVKSGGLSPGAIAGIAVGSCVLVAIVAALVFLVVRKRRVQVVKPLSDAEGVLVK